jgi:hypothetical protein
MKTVKIYNIKKAVESANEFKRTSREDELAIIQGTKGIIVTDNEAVHAVFDNTDEKVTLQIHKKNGDKMSLIPVDGIDVPIEHIQKEVDFREETLTSFVRRFGNRIESNYNLLLNSLKEIGLNPADYPRLEEQNA